MEYILLLGIIFFLFIALLVANYDNPSQKLDFSRYTNTKESYGGPKVNRLRPTNIKGQFQKFSEINDLKLVPEVSYFKRNQWTIMFWIKIHLPKKMVYVQKGRTPLMFFDPPYFKFFFNTPSGRFETTDNLEQSSTKHFVWVQDNMSLRIFENTKPYLISDPNQDFTQNLPSGDLKIDAHFGNISFRNFRICNTAQTYNQILEIYKTEKPIITGEKYIEKKATREEIEQARRNGEIYSPETKLVKKEMK